jgi:hypothetical protein
MSRQNMCFSIQRTGMSGSKNRLWSHVTVKKIYYHERPCLDCSVPTSTVQHLITGDYQRSHSRVTPIIMLLPCSDRCRRTPCHGQIPHTDLSSIVTTDTDIRCFMHSYCSYSLSMAFQDLHQSIILSKTVNQQDMHDNKWCFPLCQVEKTYYLWLKSVIATDSTSAECTYLCLVSSTHFRTEIYGWNCREISIATNWKVIWQCVHS